MTPSYFIIIIVIVIIIIYLFIYSHELYCYVHFLFVFVLCSIFVSFLLCSIFASFHFCSCFCFSYHNVFNYNEMYFLSLMTSQRKIFSPMPCWSIQCLMKHQLRNITKLHQQEIMKTFWTTLCVLETAQSAHISKICKGIYKFEVGGRLLLFSILFCNQTNKKQSTLLKRIADFLSVTPSQRIKQEGSMRLIRLA